VTPIALLVTEPIIFSVAADSPIKTGGDLIELLKNDPDSVSIAVSSSAGRAQPCRLGPRHEGGGR